MKLHRTHRTWTAWVICASLMLQSIGAAGEPLIKTTDVRLDAHGALVGQVVDRQGTPVAGSVVTLWNDGNLVSQSETTDQGRFQFAELRGGVYQVATPQTGGNYRVWTHQTAPPSSQPAILLIQGEAVRGQCQDCVYANSPCDACQAGFGGGHYGGAVIRAFNNPWLLGGLIAAGVAIPIAVSNSDDAEGS